MADSNSVNPRPTPKHTHRHHHHHHHHHHCPGAVGGAAGGGANKRALKARAFWPGAIAICCSKLE